MPRHTCTCGCSSTKKNVRMYRHHHHQFGSAINLDRRFYSSPSIFQSGGNVLLPYQSGAGIADWLGKGIRFLTPFFSPILDTIKNEALNSTRNILQDVSSEPTNWRNILRAQGQQSLQNLSSQAREGILNKIDQLQQQQQQQRGSGIGRSRKRAKSSLLAVARRRSKSSSRKRRAPRSVQFNVVRRGKKSSKIKRRSSKSKISGRLLF